MSKCSASFSLAVISDGKEGAKGQSLTSASEQWYLSTSGTSPEDGSWEDAKPSVNSSTFLWRRLKLIWTNPSGTTYSTAALVDTADTQSPYVRGTQTAATGSWTGNAPTISALYSGLTIRYYLPCAGSGNATLNLTLKGGATTGAVNCYYSNTTRLTTHYGAGSLLTLTYLASADNKAGANGWFCTPQYYTYDNYNKRYYNAVKAKTAVTSGRIIAASDETGYFHVIKGSVFSVKYPLLWAGSNISAGSAGSNNYESYYSVNLNANVTGNSFTAYKPVYLKGKLNSDIFTADSTTAFTSEEPSEADDFDYMYLGLARNTYDSSAKTYHTIALDAKHDIYRHNGVSFAVIGNCSCSVSCNKSVVSRNDRAAGSETFVFTVDVQGYTETPVLAINGSSVTLIQNGSKYSYSHVQPLKGASAITASVSLNSVETASLALSVVDKTEYYKFFGAMTDSAASELSTRLKGDTYVDISTNTIMYWTGSQWQQFSLGLLSSQEAGLAGRILSAAESSYWNLWSSMSDVQKQELFNLYGYKAEVISRFIAAERIQMYADGVIASSAVSTNKAESIDSKGFLTAQGYRLEGDSGIIRAKNAYLSSVFIDALSKIYGEIVSDSLETHNGGAASKTFVSNTAGNTKYWSYSDLKDAMTVSNVITSASGSYAANTVSQYAKITDSKHIHGTSGLMCLQIADSYDSSQSSYEDTFGSLGEYGYTETADTGKDSSVSHSYTNSTANTQTAAVKWSLKKSNGKFDTTITVSVDGVAKISASNNTSSGSVSVPSGSTLTLTLSSSFYTTYYGSAIATIDLQQSSLLTAGINSLGLWLYYASSWHRLSETAYQATALSLLGVTNSYICWQSNCYESGAGTPTPSGGYSSLASTSTVTVDNLTFTPELAAWNSDAISFSNTNGQTVVISKTSYFKTFSFSFTVQASSSSVKTAKLLPKDSSVTIGEQSEPWNAVYAKAFFGLIDGQWTQLGKGEKGDKGDIGPQGIQGPKGDKGDQGVGVFS